MNPSFLEIFAKNLLLYGRRDNQQRLGCQVWIRESVGSSPKPHALLLLLMECCRAHHPQLLLPRPPGATLCLGTRAGDSGMGSVVGGQWYGDKSGGKGLGTRGWGQGYGNKSMETRAQRKRMGTKGMGTTWCCPVHRPISLGGRHSPVNPFSLPYAQPLGAMEVALCLWPLLGSCSLLGGGRAVGDGDLSPVPPFGAVLCSYPTHC